MEQHAFGIHRAEDPPGGAGRSRLEWKVAEMPQARPLICHRSTAPLRSLDAGEGSEAPLMLQLPGLAVALGVHEQAVAHGLEENTAAKTFDDVEQLFDRVRIVAAHRAGELNAHPRLGGGTRSRDCA